MNRTETLEAPKQTTASGEDSELRLTDKVIIEKHLAPLLEATETKFFPYRGQIERMRPAEKGEGIANENIHKHLLPEAVVETIQVIEER